MSQEKKKVTLHDIAAECDVSVATVSMALSGKGKISQELRNTIKETATALGYTRRIPNGNTSGRAVVILSYVNHDWAYIQDFITPIFVQIEMKLTKNNLYPVIIPITNVTTNREVREAIHSCRAISVISIHYTNETLFREIEYEGIPITIINNSALREQFYSICIDDYQGAYDGAKYLIDLNHRHLLFMDYWREKEQLDVYIDRFIGFKKAIDEYHIPFESAQRITFDIEDQSEIGSGLMNTLRLYPKTTAIFAHDDRLAIRLYVELLQNGYRVPEDISLIAPGDTLDYSLPYIPKITTLKIDTNLLGSLSADSILQRIENTAHINTSSLRVTQQLVRRESCRRIDASTAAL
ncbi:MAG: LacI family DNA-binding transcriptional regulator [Spirochaetota bacterium]